MNVKIARNRGARLDARRAPPGRVQGSLAERPIARARAVADPCSPIYRGFKRMHGSNSSRSRLARVLALAAATVGAALALAAPAGAAENFVIGDENATVGTQVEFWGAQWWKLNSLSGGTAPASFKGFANEVEGGCGGTWTTDPGNKSEPPEGPLPPVIEAISAHSVTKKGKVISGDIVSIVLIATEEGYGPSPGHAGTGTVIGVVCGPGSEKPKPT